MKIGDAKIECPACHETIRVPLMAAVRAKGSMVTFTADHESIREHVKAHAKLEPTK